MLRLILLFLLLPLSALARPYDGAAICEQAAIVAARESGVPADILGALTLTETGRRRDGVVRPWAWSVNAEGAGSWFDDPQSALSFAQGRIAAGRPNVDIGCFQINYRWHGENFASVSDMFDPLQNARYAARFVGQLYQETGDWRAAAGAFHSRTPLHANRYLKRFDDLRVAFRARGFDGLTDTPETYNQFAQAMRASGPGPRIPLEPQTILGLPLGSERTGHRGSLAALGGSRGGMFGAHAPLMGGHAPLVGVRSDL